MYRIPRLVTMALIGLIFLYPLHFTALPADHNVCERGCDFSEIQKAIDASDSGDNLLIHQGSFRTNLQIDKELTLKGRSEGGTEIIGSHDFLPAILVGPSEATVKLERLTVIDSAGSGIMVTGDASAELEELSVRKSRLQGVKIQDSAQAVLSSCKILHNDWLGIELSHSSTLVAVNSIISGNKWGGVGLRGGAHGTLNHVQLSDNLNGAEAWNSATLVVNDSTIFKNSRGINVGDSARGFLENNEFRDNRLACTIRMKECGFPSAPEEPAAELIGTGNRFYHNGTMLCPDTLDLGEERTD
ncbi:MAG: right-handed parallel beta-helix repeat-containing protein [Candidatus Bipolaricaulota bacterium]